MKWKVAMLQMDIAFGQPDNNREMVRKYVAQLAQGGKTDILVLPELWDTGYDLPRFNEIADDEGAQAKRLLRETALQLDAHVIGGSIAERKGINVYNTTYVLDRNGVEAGSYSKVHLYRQVDEDKYVTAGETPGLYIVDGQNIASVIGYDICFPEYSRSLALRGAKVLVVCAQWPHPRLHHWRQLLIARAIENQMYVVACNRVGEGGGTIFCGHSLVVNPLGEVVNEGMQQEAIITAELDLALVDEVREQTPVFADRRSQLYAL